MHHKSNAHTQHEALDQLNNLNAAVWLIPVVSNAVAHPMAQSLGLDFRSFKPSGMHISVFIAFLVAWTIFSFAVEALVLWIAANFIIGSRGESTFWECFRAVFLITLVVLGSALLGVVLAIMLQAVGMNKSVPMVSGIIVLLTMVVAMWKGSVAVLEGIGVLRPRALLATYIVLTVLLMAAMQGVLYLLRATYG